ncbi:MAG: HD domain-containing protein [Gammaproteobacteria bacterium]|nr:HD domain-containing protein [Gammaproteobacteria bacterium]MBV9621882.1 HD domain-containing protein [Gammaproteobacteria bacterium]
MSVSAEVLALFARHGGDAYFGERVSMREHALQAAHFARLQGAPDPLVLAALLHDVGHLLEDVPAALEDWTHDARHEEVGARWLKERFGPEICEPVRLHVPAKRYLCAIDPHYFAQLSAASVHTLALQGGPMSAQEIAGFEAEPQHREAVRVRHCDDLGKMVGLVTEPLEAYAGLIDRLAR